MEKYLTTLVVSLLLFSGYASAEQWPECDIPNAPSSGAVAAAWGNMTAIDSCISNAYFQLLKSRYSVDKSRSIQFEALKQGDAKAGILSVGQYVALKEGGESNLVPIAAMPMSHGKIGFHSQLVSKSLVSLEEISRIKTDQIQLQSDAAITGLSAPFTAIKDYLPIGTSPEDLMLNPMATDEAATALTSLMDGVVEVSSWWSTEPDEAMKEFGGPDDYNVLWSSPVIPHTAIVVSRELGQDAIDSLKYSLLNMNEETLKCINDSLAWEIKGFQSVDEQDYKYVQDAYNVGLKYNWLQEHH